MTIPAQPSRSPSSSNFDADDERGYEIFKAAIPRMYLCNALGFAVLGVVAWFTQRSGLFADSGLFIYILTIGAWLVAVFGLSLLVRRTAPPASALLYLGLSVLGGLMAALIMGSYTDGSIVLACALCAALYGVMATITLSTGRNLYAGLSLLAVAAFAIAIAAAVNMLIGSGILGWTLSMILPPLSLLLVRVGINTMQTSAIEAIWTNAAYPVNQVAIRGTIGLYVIFATIAINSTAQQHTIFQGRMADRGQNVRPGGPPK